MNWLKSTYIENLVSIIIPSFNRADLIIETLRSAIAQEYKMIELIIVDDGSTDNTAYVIDSFAKNNNSIVIKYIRQDKRGGPAARNEGARQSNGEFLQFFDSDDLMHKEYISKRVESLKCQPTIDFCICNGEFLDTIDKEIIEPTSYDKNPQTLEFLINQKVPIMTLSLLGTRYFFDRLGPWDETILRGQDLEYFSRIYFHNFKSIWIPEILYTVRIHKNNLSLDWSPEICENIILTYQKIQTNSIINSVNTKKLNQVLANRITSFSIRGLNSGYFKIGLKYFISYWRYLPLKKKILRGGYFVLLIFKRGLFIKRKVKLRNYINTLFFKRKKNFKWADFEYFDESWKERIRVMSKYISSQESILDLGCGKMWLRDYIQKSNIYYGIDYKKRDENTIVCDFEKGEFPNINADVAFVSGTLEYVTNYKEFISKISFFTQSCIISYCSIDFFNSISDRRRLGWKNHLSVKELISYFDQNNFELIQEVLTKQNNTILYLRKK